MSFNFYNPKTRKRISAAIVGVLVVVMVVTIFAGMF